MKNPRFKYINVAVLLVSIILSFCIVEIYVRWAGSYDIDGNFYFRNRQLKPYRLPIKSIDQDAEKILKNEGSFYLQYDPYTGWGIGKKIKASNGPYISNSLGIRSQNTEQEFSEKPHKLRIALFGDSFTHGDEVPYESTWAYLLEKNLNNAGLDVEVMNFGVCGYGFDQAYLRWLTKGIKFSPDIVVLGFVSIDVQRAVNIFRFLLTPRSNFPFSKPRYVLSGDDLKLVNSPAMSPKEVAKTLNSPDKSEILKYEYYYNADDYQDKFWRRSKFVSLFSFTLNDLMSKYESQAMPSEDYMGIDSEAAKLSLRIISEFGKSVKANKARFLIVTLPQPRDLRYFQKRSKLEYADILTALKQRHDVICAEERLLDVYKAKGVGSLFMERGHYTPPGHKIVADIVSQYLIKTYNIK